MADIKKGASPQREEARLQARLIELERAAGMRREPPAPDNSYSMYEQIWFGQLVALAMSRRKWTGLPEEIDERYLERLLLMNGRVVFAIDEDGPRVWQCTDAKGWDEQENYTQVIGTGANGKQTPQLDASNSVVCWDSEMRMPLMPALRAFAKDLAHYDQACSTNLQQQRAMFLLSVSPENEKDAKEIMRNLGEGAPGMLTYRPKGGAKAEDLRPQVLQTGIKPEMDLINDAQHEKLTKAYNMLGIENVPVEKKERLVQGEAESGDSLMQIVRRGFVLPCQMACKQMNKVFGWNVSVEWNDPKPEEQPQEKGEDDADDKQADDPKK